MTYDDLEGDVIICLRATQKTVALFTDNRIGVCAICQVKVVYRPHVPWPHTLICLQCWHPKDGDAIHITRKTVLEYLAVKARN